MRKMVAVVGLVAFVMAMGTAALADNGDFYLKSLPVHWEVGKAAVNTAGLVDSAQKSLSAATDTSAKIETADIAWEAYRGGQVVATPVAIGSIHVTSPNTTANVDTLNYAIQASYNGTNWFTVQGLTAGQVAPATTTKALGCPIYAKNDGTITTLMAYPYIRFLVKQVTGTFTAADLKFRYLARRWQQ